MEKSAQFYHVTGAVQRFSRRLRRHQQRMNAKVVIFCNCTLYLTYQKQGVALTGQLAYRVLPRGELRCIYECYRRRQTTTTDATDRYYSGPLHYFYNVTQNDFWCSSFSPGQRPLDRSPLPWSTADVISPDKSFLAERAQITRLSSRRFIKRLEDNIHRVQIPDNN